MNRQEEILLTIAKRHGITKTQAEEVWTMFGRTISKIISEPQKDSQGLLNEEDFKIIHVDNFGKFIPRPKMIRKKNKLKLEENECIDNTTIS